MDDYSFDNTLKSDRLREILRQSIAGNDFQPGDRIPSEPELVSRYKVSRSTVREAITALVQEGLLYRIHGKGTFIAEVKPEHRTFAVLMPFLFFNEANPFAAGTDVVPRLMQVIEGEARRTQANILLYLSNRRISVERENIENLLQRGVDGVLLNGVSGDRNRDVIQRVQDSGIPIVLIDHFIPHLPVDFVVTDNERGAYRASRLLATQGFERVVHVTSPGDHSALRDRRAGYERAMREMDLTIQVSVVEEEQIDASGFDTVSEEERAYRLAQSLLASTELPFAVFAAEAPILAGIWRAMEEYGLPHDRIAFACFDEPFIEFPRNVFSLKIIQPFAEIGRRSIALLHERIGGNGPTEPCQIFIEPEIITSKV
jgi:GntR family transcriptional regulator of arabinose operon